jgi:citrate lyase subunit beta/citryl-CoA lyase
MIMRSFLFVPATSERKLRKAALEPVDAVIVDLEDSIAVSEKAAARETLGSLPSLLPGKPCWVRVNDLSTDFCYEDMIAVVRAGVAGIILPKVESRSAVRTADWLIRQLERQAGLAPAAIGLMAIIETARGLSAVDRIARASPRLGRLFFGAVDMAADMGVSLADAAGATDQARFAIARASAAARLQPPVDTAFTDIANLDALRATSGRAKSLGFGGKACIHPAQVPVVNDVFSPSKSETDWANKVVSAFRKAEADGKAALSLDGEMIDYPVFERAKKLLRISQDVAPVGDRSGSFTDAG